MEPVTHLLTGACLARAGCNRKAAYATLTMVVAAQLPDIDTLWGLRGPVEGFMHHRGITHTFLGVPFEAALLVGAVYGWHRWRARRYAARAAALPPDKQRILKPLNKAPVRWGVLYGFALVALLSHLLLDFTNNYGLRPLFPFEDHWYAASIVFIFDPLIFGLLVAALVLPSLFGLVSSEVGARSQAFRGRGLAISALLAIVAIWGFRYVQHGKAVQLAMQQTYAYVPEAAGAITASDLQDAGQSDTGQPDVAVDRPPIYLQAQRALASPDPLNPFHWSVTTDFGAVYQLSEVDTRNGSVTPEQTSYPKPGRSVNVLRAQASPLGGAYMDWSPMPIVTAEQNAPGSSADIVGEQAPVGGALVMFRDPRFMGGIDWLHLGGRTPLTGIVTLDAQGRLVNESMDGRAER